MNKSRFYILLGMIVAAAATRLIPHPPGFVPVAAMALFGGATFDRKRDAFLVPLVAMFLSDLVLGFHALLPVIYATFALIVGLGFYLRGRRTFWNVTSMSVAGAVLFFVITNLAVWFGSGMYPLTSSGLIACYVAAIPFFWNTLLSDLLYAALLFGGLALIEKKWPLLTEPEPLPA